MEAGERINVSPPAAGRFSGLRFLLPAFFLAAARLAAAAASPDARDDGFPENLRGIPGLAQADIQAIEKALSGRKSFSFGAMKAPIVFIGMTARWMATQCHWPSC